MAGFYILSSAALMLVLMGVAAFRSKEPVNFWSALKVKSVSNTKEYNKAVGWLWIRYAASLFAGGIFLLGGQNSIYAVITALLILLGTIVFMIGYSKIENKYKVKAEQ